MNKLIVFGFSLLIAGSVSAAESTEYWDLIPAGQNWLKVAVASSAQKYTTKTTTTSQDLEATGTPISFKYLRGLNEQWAMAVGFDTGTDKWKQGSSEAKDTGLSDLTLGAWGNSDMSGWRLWYGADLGVNMGPKKNYTSNKDGTRGSGGLSLTPYVGAHYLLNDAWAIGGKLEYGMPFERTETDQNSTPEVDSKKTGGQSFGLAPYAEYNYGDGVVGAYFALKNYNETKTKASGSSTETTGAAQSWTLYGLWASYNFGTEFTALLNYDASSLKEYDSAPGQKTSGTASKITLAGRYHF